MSSPPPRLWLARARVPAVLLEGVRVERTTADGLATVDLELEGGTVRGVRESGERIPEGAWDLDLGQVWPAFVDVHTHLDKGHILPRAANPDATVPGAVRSVEADRTRNWSAADVRQRFEFGLRCAYAHGTAALRTHLDCEPPQAPITWPVFAALREAWRGRLDLQGVGKYPLHLYPTPAGADFARLVAEHRGILGGVTRVPAAAPDAAARGLDQALDALFALAGEHGLDVDLHVDESGDPKAATLGQVARAVLRSGFRGQVVCGHCCSLAVQPAAQVEEVLGLCAAARLRIVTLPMINQYLQDRGAATPRWRGVTLVHELAARGIPVAVASDNCRDPFFAYGDLDMLEVFNQAVRIAHLDRPYGPWPAAATRVPAQLMGLGHRGMIGPGRPADLVVFRARTMSELLARPQADRQVWRAGVPVAAPLPDFRELDTLYPGPA